MDIHPDETTQIQPPLAAGAVKVLLVVDDELLLERLNTVVTTAGFEVSIAADAASALATLKRELAAIVILNHNIPGMDGIKLCRAIRRDTYSSRVYVLLLTLQDSEEELLAGLDAGANDCLSRRASPALLLARLRTAQRLLSLEQSLRAMVEERQRLVTSDALTGAHNRSYFMRHLSREIKRTHRFGGELSLLTLDIDHFKQVNQQYGHTAGDAVLCELVRRIHHCLPRDYDWCARLGGEEFAVVLPQTALEGAALVAEKLRRMIEAEPILTDLDGATVKITVSLGVCGLESLPERAGATPDLLLAHAARLLDRSKRAGRNRLVTADRIHAG